jgi:hypothetical protein
MPAGAQWTLRYNPTGDGRIQARVYAQRLRDDEFVQSVTTTETNTTCNIEVQFRDDRDAPHDDRLRREVEGYRVLPSVPLDPTQSRTQYDLLRGIINAPIRREFAQSFSEPIRRNIDYTAVARRTFLTPDFEPSDILENPLSNDQFVDAVDAMMYANLRVPENMLTGVPQEVPAWLKVGIWVTSKSKYAEVTNIDGSSVVGFRVSLKMWRVQESRTILLSVLLSYWTKCDKPVDPPSRYERILRGLR